MMGGKHWGYVRVFEIGDGCGRGPGGAPGGPYCLRAGRLPGARRRDRRRRPPSPHLSAPEPGPARGEPARRLRLRRLPGTPPDRPDEIDVVVALEIGADDYVTKPLRLRELAARVAAHLRRARMESAEAMRTRLEFRDLIIDVNERRIYKSGKEVELTHTEFDLLTFLASNAGKVLSREKILNAIWGYEYPIETRVIDVHIRNLRRKIETQPARPYYILAVPGIGYRFTNARPT